CGLLCGETFACWARSTGSIFPCPIAGKVRVRGLGGVRPEAAGADAGTDCLAAHCDTAHLEVGHEPPVDPVLGVADVMSVLRRLAANLTTFGHGLPFAWGLGRRATAQDRSEEHTSELQSRGQLVCRLM